MATDNHNPPPVGTHVGSESKWQTKILGGMWQLDLGEHTLQLTLLIATFFISFFAVHIFFKLPNVKSENEEQQIMIFPTPYFI